MQLRQGDSVPSVLVVRGGWTEDAAKLAASPNVRAVILEGGVYKSVPDELSLCASLQTIVIDCEVLSLRSMRQTPARELIVRSRLPRDLDSNDLSTILDISLNEWKAWPAGLSLASFTHLRALSVGTGTPWIDLSELSPLTKLETLGLVGGRLRSTSGIEALSNLRELGISGCRSLESTIGLDALPHLEWLRVERAPKLAEIEGLEHLARLNELYLFCEASVKSTRFLRNSPNIRRLWLDLPIAVARWEDVLSSPDLITLGLRWGGTEHPTLSALKDIVAKHGRNPTSVKKAGTPKNPFYVVAFD
jgi:Leucine-rich repeat (LRR) protein